MTKKAEIEGLILSDPSRKNNDIAIEAKTSKHMVEKIRSEMYKEGKLERPVKLKHPAFEETCQNVGIDVSDVKQYWYKGQHFSIMVKNNPVSYFDIAGEIMEEMKKYAPKYNKIEYKNLKDGHLLVIDPADIHIGKLCSAFETGDEYNHKIAIDRVKSGVLGLIDKAKGFRIDKVLIIIGNDILHIDNAKSSTTSGTFQDSELMWYDAFKVAFNLIVEMIEICAEVAPVHVQYDPSNHDYMTGFFLAQAIEAWFKNHNGITFNVSPAHRKYYVYGKNIIGSTHGDGAKWNDLGYLMAHEAKDWNKCQHRYFYVHHIHHKKSIDQMSVCVESLRSPSGTDSWHHRNGYQHAPKAVEGFIHHKDHGQIARLTHLF